MVHSFEQDLLKIIEIFKANYDGHPWHGVTTESILLRNSPRNIISKPDFIKKNLWIMLMEIVEWKKLLIEYLKGEDINFNKEAEKMKITAPENILDQEWASLIADLKSVHFLLIAELKKVLSLEVTERIFPNHLSFSQIAYGIIHSELFCLGQINILIEFSDSFVTEQPKVLLRKYLTPAHRSLRK
ncbi:hypothetical protein [Daejeonella lutea]|uniref:DinB superfamily protein n=1 Tax=Daejeonella lutea TaxID=572036 RepID=A0A1T5BCC4_9SPHI|nr:hypothetical protein [Daejeonella lutea]SKB44932.1 hypothetical protein SAMN05661099_1493 [Daejeonella lutea]